MKQKFIIILIILFLATGCACSKKDAIEEVKENVIETNEKAVTNEQIIDGIRFKNVSLVVKDGKTEFRVTLENTVTTIKKLSHLEITFKDEMDNIVKTVNHYDFNNLKKGDIQNLSYSFSLDMSNVKKIEYKFE